MQLGCNSKKFAGVVSALALCMTSTGAIAASTPRQAAISPFVALSALGSDVSAAALCASSAVAGAAAVAQGASPGCVLPAIDQAPPPAVVETAPPPYAVEPVAPMGGAGVSPLLVALAGIATAVALYYLVFRGNDNFDIIFPPFPQSPA